MDKLVYGIGINDGSRPSKSKEGHFKQYEMWRGMLRRCYSPKERIKFAAYDGCTVSENFKSYSYFYDWCQNQVGFSLLDSQLDKDLLIKGNKVYSENTCVFLPKELNVLIQLKKSQRGRFLIGVSKRKDSVNFISQISIYGGNKTLGCFSSELDAFNAYKEYKENHIKLFAKKYSSSISVEAYNALMNYTVEITD